MECVIIETAIQNRLQLKSGPIVIGSPKFYQPVNLSQKEGQWHNVNILGKCAVIWVLCQFRCNWCVMLVCLNTHVMGYWCQSVALKCDTVAKVHAALSGPCTGQLRPTSLNSDCFDIYVLSEEHSDCHPCQCSPSGSSRPKCLLLVILQVSCFITPVKESELYEMNPMNSSIIFSN